MNEKYLLGLSEDLRLKNFTQNTCDDYYRFTKWFREFTGKESMSITYTMYSSGLRVSEVCRLRYEDIRRSQRMIHVPLSKNRLDRYTILSDRNLEILTKY